jgi:ADP-ribosyl-[dinitrogen reductase] hydrolase
MSDRADQIAGVILGTAVGDALGLPCEGLSPRRARRMFGPPPLRHRFLFGRGMVSDDTEHTVFVARSLLKEPDNPERFVRALAGELRWWLLGIPAGAGLATLRSTLKLWVGFAPTHSGVWSAGNGPAMRSALLGVCLGDNLERLRAFVRASTRLTHADPRAERGALLVALAAHHGAIVNMDASTFLASAREALPDADDELIGLLSRLEDHLARDATPAEFIASLGLRFGVTGYVYHTVPAALYCWLRFPRDFRRAVEEVILLGGDADTTGAITGAIAGAAVGTAGIPADWLDGIRDWPWSVTWLRRLAEKVARRFVGSGSTMDSSSPSTRAARLPRNALFAMVVLAHGFRRLLPPY